jgi:hypothetical protein
LLALAPVERFDPEGLLILRAGPDVEFASVVALPGWVKPRFEELPIPKTRTDSEGRFKLVGVDPGVSTLIVTAPGWAPLLNPALRTKSGQDKDLGVLRLKHGETAQGRVIDALGKPVARAEVLVAPTSAAMPVDFAGQPLSCDAEGRFELAGLPAGSATVAARRGPRDGWVVQAPAPVAGDLVVRLPALATLTVRLASKVGKALEQVRLQLVPAPSQPGMALGGMATPLPIEGRMEQQAPGVSRIADLPLGQYLLFATAKGPRPGRRLAEARARPGGRARARRGGPAPRARDRFAGPADPPRGPSTCAVTCIRKRAPSAGPSKSSVRHPCRSARPARRGRSRPRSRPTRSPSSSRRRTRPTAPCMCACRCRPARRAS